MVRKKIAMVLAVLFILGSIFACHGCKKSEDPTSSKTGGNPSGSVDQVDQTDASNVTPPGDLKQPTALPKDTLLLDLDSPQLTIFASKTIKYFEFSVVSSEPLKEEDLSVSLDQIDSVPFSLIDEEVDSFEFLHYQIFKRTDWKEYRRLEKTHELFISTRDEKYREEAEKYEAWEKRDKSEYEDWSKKNPTQYYRYHLQIDLKPVMASKVDKISSIKVTYKGKVYEKDVSFHFNYDDISYDSDDGFELLTSGIYGMNIKLIPDGKIVLQRLDFETTKDVKITGMSMYASDSVQVTKATLAIHSGTTIIDQQWEPGETRVLSKGSSGAIEVTIRDEKFRDKNCYHAVYTLVIDYEIDGVAKQAHIDILAYTKPAAFLIAMN